MWSLLLDIGLDDDLEALMAVVQREIQLVENRRYLYERTQLPTQEKWVHILSDTDRFNDGFFLRHFRMERDIFWTFEHLMTHRTAFQTVPTQRARAPVPLQLLTLLKYMGTEGTDGSYSKIGDFLGISCGSVLNFIKRSMTACMEIKDSVITWPDEEERLLIGDRMESKFGFSKCVGLVDGTLFPLEYKPKSNGEEYYTRKGNYAINGLVFVDDTSRVRLIMAGYPGSVHDNRVWRNSLPNNNKSDFFSADEYLLGDSAFSPSDVMVPAFKKPTKSEMGKYEKFFNNKLAKIRIRTEHAIGLMKNRFPRLRRIRVRIRDRATMAMIVKQIIIGAMLHNLLLSEPLPDDVGHNECDLDEIDVDDDETTDYNDISLMVRGDIKRDDVMAGVLAHFNQ